MATMTPQKITQTGLAVTLQAAAAGGDKFPAAGNRAVRVTNGGASPTVVTINSIRPCDQGFDHDITVNVPAGATRDIGPFDYGRFADSSGLVSITYSTITSVTVGTIEL